MIHSTLHGSEPRRRIAVVEFPRNQISRLGSIANAPTTFSGLAVYSGVYPTVTTDPSPSDASQWLAQKVQEQSDARDTTPGTLMYTPTPLANPANVTGTWNSWAGPCAGQPGAAIPDPAGPAKASHSKFLLYLAAGLGAAASAVYLIEGKRY